MTKNNYLKISLLDDSNEKGSIYLTGNFNGWKPADERYQMINASGIINTPAEIGILLNLTVPENTRPTESGQRE